MNIVEIEEDRPLSGVLLSDTHLSSRSSHEDYDVLKAISDYSYDNDVDFQYHLGDLGDFPSLNKFKGSTLMSGNYAGSDDTGHDVQYDIESFGLGLKALKSRYDYEEKKNKAHRHPERTKKVNNYIGFGNHEHFLFGLKNKHKSLTGMLSMAQHNIRTISESHGFETFDFLQTVILNGLCLKHYVESKNPKVRLGISAIQSKNSMSTAVGDTHEKQVHHWIDGRGREQTILNTGCTKHPSRLARHESSGIYHIKNLYDGEFTYEWVPTTILLDRYYAKTEMLRHAA